MIQLEFEIETFELFIFERGYVASSHTLLFNPSELVSLVKLAYLDVVGKRLTSCHEVSIVFLITRPEIIFIKRVIIRGPDSAQNSHLHFNILLHDLTLFAHLKGIDGYR